MLKGLAIAAGLATTSILGLATMSVLSVNLATPAFAGCGENFDDCDQLVALVCGNDTFLAGSDRGNALDMARIKARNGGYNPSRCQIRNLR